MNSAQHGMITDQMKIALSTLVRQIFDQLLQGGVNTRVDELLNKRMEDDKQFTMEAVQKRIDSLTPDTLDKQLQDILNKYTEATKTDLRRVEDRVKSIVTQNMPVTYVQRFSELLNKVGELDGNVRMLRNELKKYVNTQFVELVTNEEIKKLYTQSGVTVKEIMDHFNYSQTAAYNFVNGQVENPLLRHELKQYLIQKITSREVSNANV